MYKDSWASRVLEIGSSQSSSEDQPQIEHQSISDSEEQIARSSFWAPWLRRDTEALGFEIPRRRQPLTMLSCCSGACSEAAVLKDRHLWQSCDS